MKNKNLIVLIYVFFMAIGFKAEKPVFALIIGGIPIALFIIYTIANLRRKKTGSSTAKDIDSKNNQSDKKSNWTNSEPKYYVNIKRFDGSRTIGSYHRGQGDYENIYLVRKDAKWFVKGTAMWPVRRGASNGGQYEHELNAEYFERFGINSVKLFLEHHLKGQTEPCITLALKENELVTLLDKIIESKGRYIPEGEPPVDETHICYKFVQEYSAHNERLKVQAHKYPLITAAEFLFNKGFVFCSASAGGGIDEIGHTGDKSYSVEYTDFVDFRDNFEKDMDEAEKEERENSGGWISSLNYGILNIYLKRKDLRINISVEGYTVRVHWYDVTKVDELVFSEVNQVVMKTLGRNVEMTKETCFKYDFGEKFEKNFLSNWDIHHKIEYWSNDDTGGVVREISPFEFEYLRKGETEWTKLQPDNSFEREVY